MIDTYESRLKVFQEATAKAAEESPELIKFTPGAAHSAEDLCLVVANLLADGDAGAAVFIGGREFAQKALTCIDSPQDYEVCARLSEAIQGGTSIFDGKGEAGTSYRTAECEELMGEVQHLLDSQVV